VSTTAGIRYANIPLPLVTPELEGFLRSYLDTRKIEWFPPLTGGANSYCYSWFFRQPQIELSKLIWPVGIGRFATALFVASNSQYEAILAKVDRSPVRTAESLVVGQKEGSTGKVNIIDVKMHLLNAVRVTGAPAGEGSLWLLPLVDDRYYRLLGSKEYWTLKSEKKWDSWFTSAFEAMGYPSWRGEVVDEVYGGPGSIYWPEDNTPLMPPLIDSAAYSINRRVVKQFDGEIDLMDISTAENLWKIKEGQAVIAGSRGKNTRIVLPEIMSFKWGGGDTIDVAADSLMSWGNQVAWSGVHAYYMRCDIPANMSTEALLFCETYTEENLRWRFIRQNISFPGIVNLQLTGAEDRVEFLVNSTTAMTSVYAEQNDMVDSMSVNLDPDKDPTCESCGGGGGGAENCPRVSFVGCTAGILSVGYQLNCESVPDPIAGPPAGGPVGTIAMWGLATLPNGWLECNGQQFDPLNYPELFDLLGSRYVPDLSNQFVRGKGDKTGGLLSKKGWTTSAPKNPFTVSYTGDHAHSGGVAPGGIVSVGNPDPAGVTAANTGLAGLHTHTITGGDSETAPDHVVLIYMIKAQL